MVSEHLLSFIFSAFDNLPQNLYSIEIKSTQKQIKFTKPIQSKEIRKPRWRMHYVSEDLHGEMQAEL